MARRRHRAKRVSGCTRQSQHWINFNQVIVQRPRSRKIWRIAEKTIVVLFIGLKADVIASLGQIYPTSLQLAKKPSNWGSHVSFLKIAQIAVAAWTALGRCFDFDLDHPTPLCDPAGPMRTRAGGLLAALDAAESEGMFFQRRARIGNFPAKAASVEA